MQRRPVWDRFWEKVDTTGDCWLWTAHTVGGYGALRIDGKDHRAHRLSAAWHFGMFDRRTHVLHRCDTPACVRPEHLYLGDHVQNMADRHERGRQWCAVKTHCKRGHEFSPENTYLDKRGTRVCRACNAQRMRVASQKGTE
jgi:hypothetical protein